MLRKIFFLHTFTFLFSTSLYTQGNWELLIPSGTSNQMVSLYFRDELNGWSVGQHGTITRTTDGGISWEVVEIDLLTNLTDVYFPSESIGYIVGEDGLILNTSNGGETWEKQENIYINNLRRVKFRDDETGWIIGESGFILHTSNGGVTWTKQTSGSRFILSGIEIVDEQHVCIVGSDTTILLTEDDGATWQRMNIDINNENATYNFTDVYFADSLNGWVCATGHDWTYPWPFGCIAKTSDGSRNWTLLEGYYDATIKDLDQGGYHRGGHMYPLVQIYFNNDLTTGLCLTSPSTGGIGHGTENLPLYTNNEGLKWNVYINGYQEGSPRKGRFQFLTESRVINTGFQGDIRFSNDGGQNWYFNNMDQRFWYDFQIGPDNKLHALYRKRIRNQFHDREYKHLISADKGATWNEAGTTIHYLDGTEEELHIINSSQMNNFGQYTLTSDRRLYLLHRRNLSDTTHSILYSEDMGINYNELRSHVQTFRGSNWRFLTPDTLIAAYLSSIEVEPDVYKGVFISEVSYDGGNTIIRKVFHDVWNQFTSGFLFFPQIYDSYYLNCRTGFIVGTDGNIVKTEDTGQSWENIYSGVVEHLWDIEFISQETGFVVGEFGRILKTDDGGATWRKTNSGTQEDIYTIAFLNETEGWVGTESGMRYTTDGGESWQGVPLRYQHGPIHNIKFDSAGNCYAYTLCSDTEKNWEFAEEYSGSYVLLLRMLSGAIDINGHHNSNQSRPAHISLYPNYPNPFNTRTQIQYHLPQSGFVSLNIFNLQGQLVRTLVNQTKEGGRHIVTWDGCSDAGNTVSSGVYIYQLKSDSQVKHQKLLLLK